MNAAAPPSSSIPRAAWRAELDRLRAELDRVAASQVVGQPVLFTDEAQDFPDVDVLFDGIPPTAR